MEFDWVKIIEKPEAKFKVEGNILLKFRIKNENLQKESDLLNKKLDNLINEINDQKIIVDDLKNQNNEQKAIIKNLENELQETKINEENRVEEVLDQKENEYKEQIISIQNEMEQKIAEIDTLKIQLKETKQKLDEAEKQLSKIDELSTKNQELIGDNQKLTNRINEMESILVESEEIKTKSEKLQMDLEENLSEIAQLNEKIQDLEKQMKREIEVSKQVHLQEMEMQKEKYESMISDLKDQVGWAPEEVEIAEEGQIVILLYTGEDFRYVKKKPDKGIVLILDRQESKWLLIWDKDTSFIDRRTAERQARSIAKSGWPLPNGTRIGLNFELELQGEKSIPERLLRDQHEYMD